MLFGFRLDFLSLRKVYPMLAYKIMDGLWGMGQAMFIKHLVVEVADLNSRLINDEPSTNSRPQSWHRRAEETPRRRLQTPLAEVDQDGCRGEGGGGETFQPEAADIRRRKLSNNFQSIQPVNL
jgi:hypothetical protein